MCMKLAHKLISLALIAAIAPLAGLAARITLDVDFSQAVETDTTAYGGYLNICGAGMPFPDEQATFFNEQFKPMKLLRLWGKTYIRHADRMAESLMVVMNSRNLNEYLHGSINEQEYIGTIKSYLAPIKEEYPKVEYIEAYNEFSPRKELADGLPEGMDVNQAYYMGYKAVMRAVQQLNQEHCYARPLKIGGPASAWFQHVGPYEYVRNFIRLYGQDPDPEKQIDFLSIHTYNYDFSRLMRLRQEIEGWFDQYEMAPCRIIASEVGYKEAQAPVIKRGEAEPEGPDPHVRRASGSLADAFHCIEQGIPGLHWVYPAKEERHSMLVPGALALTPRGNAILLAQQLKKNRVASTVDLDDAGTGVYSVATYDESGIGILVFNYDYLGNDPKEVVVKLENMESIPFRATRMSEQLIDAGHSNYFHDKDRWELEPVNRGVFQSGKPHEITRVLEGNAVWYIRLE